MAVAVAVAFVVVLLSVAAVGQSVTTVTQSGLDGRRVDSTDAAEAGLDTVITAIKAAATTQATTFACASGQQNLSSGSTYQASYTLSYASATGTVAPAATALQTCTGTVTLQAGFTYLFGSTGKSTVSTSPTTVRPVTASNGVRTELATVYVPAVAVASYGQSTAFGEAIFAGAGVINGGAFNLTGGDTYSGSVGACVSNATYGGNYFSDGLTIGTTIVPLSVTLPSSFLGQCKVTGNLYMNNSLGVAITGGNGVGQSIYTTGPVSLSNNTTVGGSVWSSAGGVNIATGTIGGNVYSGSAGTLLGLTQSVVLSNGVVVSGNVYGADQVSMTSATAANVYAGTSGSLSDLLNPTASLTSSTVTGTVYSSGTVTLNSGTYGNVYADGTVTIQGGARVTGTVYSNGAVINNYGGTVGTTKAYQSTPAYTPTVTASTISANVAAQILAAANTTNATPNGTSTVVNFPSLTFDQIAWLDNSGFCGSATCTTSSVNFLTVTSCSALTSDVAALSVAGAKPTVIQTNCQYIPSGSSIALYNNLAIFDTAGFYIPTSFSGGFSSADGKSHQLYMIVPSSSSTVPNLGQPNVYAVTLLNTLFGTDYPNSETTCSLVDGPDINIQASLTDSKDLIQDFLYTPANVCSNNGNVRVYGQVYAGQTLSASASYTQVYDNVSPWVSGGSGNGGGVGGSLLGAPQVQSIVPG